MGQTVPTVPLPGCMRCSGHLVGVNRLVHVRLTDSYHKNLQQTEEAGLSVRTEMWKTTARLHITL